MTRETMHVKRTERREQVTKQKQELLVCMRCLAFRTSHEVYSLCSLHSLALALKWKLTEDCLLAGEGSFDSVLSKS